MENQRWMMAAVLQHLEEAKKDESLNSELLQKAGALLSEAYAINISDAAIQEKYPTDQLPLSDVYMAGREALLAARTASGAAPDAAPDADTAAKSEDDVAFDKFVKRLKRTTPFFDGVEEGSDEYARRLSRARTKFDARRKEKQETPVTPPTLPVESESRSIETPKEEVSEEVRKQANELKLEGNAFLKAKDFDRAVECYTQCIALDGSNAIYYANRAAAKMHLKELSSAVDDCKVAVSIDPTYVRAHERLANAYRALGMDELELEALEAAVRQHPDSEQLTGMLTDATNRRSATTTGAPPSRGGFPGFPGLGGGPGGSMPSPDQIAAMAQGMGMPNLSPDMIQQFLSSPLGGQMASALRGDDPAMAQMMQQGMQSMMNNPEAMNQAMQSMMSGQNGGGQNGGGQNGGGQNGGGQNGGGQNGNT